MKSLLRSFGWKDMVSDMTRCHGGRSFLPSRLTNPIEAPSRLSCGAYACWLDWQEIQGSHWRASMSRRTAAPSVPTCIQNCPVQSCHVVCVVILLPLRSLPRCVSGGPVFSSTLT